MTASDPLVLVIEDEPQVLRFLRASLSANHYRLLEATTASEGLRLAASHTPDVILLDLGLPDGDGLELTPRLREFTGVPLIVLSARGREDDKVSALDAGADDYLTKPFGMNELLARIRVALRHSEGARPSTEPTIEFGSVVIDLTKREVTKAGQPMHLTPIEYKLLVLLARHAGKVLTHRQILREVWGARYENQSHYVRVHMAELRKKLEADPARPRWLVTEQGVGYRLRDRE